MSEINKSDIAFGNIANALQSISADHILGIAEDIYDCDLKKYQSEINSSVLMQDSAAATYLPLAGGNMTGTINSASILPATTHTSSVTGYSLGSSTKQFNTVYSRYIDTVSGFNLRLKASGVEHLNMHGGAINATANILPTTTNTYNLGSSSSKWANVYATTFTGNLTGNASSATKLGSSTVGASNRPIYLNAGTPTACSVGEAFLTWGGADFKSNYGCIDAAMVPLLGANRLAFLPAECITVEYSTDAGTTWVDYGAADSNKIGLVSGLNTGSFQIGGTGAATGDTNNMLRIIINSKPSSGSGVYTTLNKFVLYLMNNSGGNAWCTIEARTQANYASETDTWKLLKEKISVSGWSGYNVINYATGVTTYGNTTSQYREIRFTFGIDSCPNTNNIGLVIYGLMGYGGVGWTIPSNMAKHGHLYSYNTNQTMILPAGLYSSAATGTVNLGDSTRYWNNTYTNHLYIRGTGSNTTSKITSDSTTNMYFDVGGVTALAVLNGSEKSVRPGTSHKNTISLGTSTVPWGSFYANDAHLSKALTLTGITQDTACINFSRSTNVTTYGYNYITAPTGGTIAIEPGLSPSSTTGYHFTSTDLRPGVTNTYNLGTSSLKFKNVYAGTFNGYTIAKSVPSDAVFTDTTYSEMTGATSTTAGASGLVPAPAAKKQTSFLRGDGTWVVPTNTTYTFTGGTNGFTVTPSDGSAQTVTVTPSISVATTSTNGLMSSTDKSKLDGIADKAEANVQSDWSITDTTSDAYIKNKPTITDTKVSYTSASGSIYHPILFANNSTNIGNPSTGAVYYESNSTNGNGLIYNPSTNTMSFPADAFIITAVSNTSSNGLTAKLKAIYAPTSSGGSTYGLGTSGQVLKTNGTTVYWATDTDTDTISIHKATVAVTANTSSIPNITCNTLTSPKINDRLQIKLSSSGNYTSTTDVANIVGFTLNGGTTEYVITKNNIQVSVNNVKINGVMDLIFTGTTTAELIYKSNINDNYVYYGTCSTVATTAEKVVTTTDQDFKLVTGVKIVVDFTYANTSSTPTLNVNSTGDKSIMYGDGSTISYIPAGPQLFVFYAENNNIENGFWKCTSTPTVIPSIYATCSTSASTTDKTVSPSSGFTGFRLFNGATVYVKFTYANTATKITLNVNGTGAKSIYYSGTNYSNTSLRYLTWTAGSIVQFIYNGTYWVVVSDNVSAKSTNVEQS